MCVRTVSAPHSAVSHVTASTEAQRRDAVAQCKHTNTHETITAVRSVPCAAPVGTGAAQCHAMPAQCHAMRGPVGTGAAAAATERATNCRQCTLGRLPSGLRKGRKGDHRL
jgi:hypothetical protein